QALDLVGERWALLVVRELVLGPKRFTDLKRGLPNASPNVISERLRELERAGVVERDKLPPPAGSRVYQLTDRGRELEDIVVALGRWGARAPAPRRDAPIGADSLALALRSRFDARAAGALRASYELRLGVDRFRAAVSDAAIDVARGAADRPDATIDTDPDTLAAVLWDGRPLADAQMRIEGDRAAVERLVGLFPGDTVA
ncbi:MAG TPA: winged helix-turn-helix transcriptional regulator, partial [Solirubrobacteraceae bacterium]|nr:winged helix-turn-helix transcriptional regulator [Solirubrobacteraceae bacterium]